MRGFRLLLMIRYLAAERNSVITKNGGRVALRPKASSEPDLEVQVGTGHITSSSHIPDRFAR